MSSNEKNHLISPDLNSLVVVATYKIPHADWDKFKEQLHTVLPSDRWFHFITQKGLIHTMRLFCTSQDDEKIQELLLKRDFRKLEEKYGELYHRNLTCMRSGLPFEFKAQLEQRLSDGLVIKVKCTPAMYSLITKGMKRMFYEQSVQEAQIECTDFIEEIMKGTLEAQEITPPTVGPHIKRTEIKSKLLNLGLDAVVNALDSAEKHIVQRNFPDAMAKCRTALEKTIVWSLEKCGLEKTDRFHNDLERLKSKGYLDNDIVNLLQKCYDYLAIVGTPHEKGSVPGLLEANLSLNITLTILEFLTNRFG